MSTSGTSSWLSADQKGNYAYERYNNDKKSSTPWLKVIDNACWGANRNTGNISTGAEFWLSSRCVDAGWSGAGFFLRYVSSSGLVAPGRVFNSDTGVSSSCRGLRPVLQVFK